MDAERRRDRDVDRVERQRAELVRERLDAGRVARRDAGGVDHDEAAVAAVLDGRRGLGALSGAHHPDVLTLEQLLEVTAPVVAAERHDARGERAALGVSRGQRGGAAALAGAAGADERDCSTGRRERRGRGDGRGERGPDRVTQAAA